MTLYTSADDGKTWRNAKVICKGSAAYSDLVIQQNNQIGVLYEKDDYIEIVYESISYENLFAATMPPKWKGFERTNLKAVAVVTYKHLDEIFTTPSRQPVQRPFFIQNHLSTKKVQ